MGLPMARRLLDAGHDVSICSRTRNAGVESLAASGATVRESPAALAAGAEIVLTALPTEASVRDVYAAMSEVADRDQLYADHSTVSIKLNQWCAEQARSQGRDPFSTHPCREARPAPTPEP